MKYKGFPKVWYVATPKTSDVYREARWIRDQRLYQSRMQRFKRKSAWKDKNKDAPKFVLSRPWIVADEDGDSRWEVGFYQP